MRISNKIVESDEQVMNIIIISDDDGRQLKTLPFVAQKGVDTPLGKAVEENVRTIHQTMDVILHSTS